MMSASTERRIRRILVAVDASADSVAAVEASVQLAAELGAEVVGVYVEDVNLVRLSRHPSPRAIDLPSGQPRRLETGELERQLRIQATRARRALAEIAGRLDVGWSFRTARGRVAVELLTGAGEVDLISLGATSGSLTRGPGSTVRAVLRESEGPVLLLRRGARLGRTLHLLHTGSAAAMRALDAAVQVVVEQEGGALTIVLLGDEERRRRAEAKVRERLREHGIEARYEHLAGREPEAAQLAAFVRRRGCGLMVAPVPLLTEDQEALRRVLWRAGCPILLVP